MNLTELLVILIIAILNTVQTQHHFYDNTNIRDPYRPTNQKVYFPGETNEREVNMKRINNAIANTFITETNSNHIDYELDGTPIVPKITGSSIINTLREVIPARRTNGVISNTANNNNNSPSIIKRVIDRIRNSSEESDERRSSTSSNRRNNNINSSEEDRRISATSIVANALVSALSRLRVCEISKFSHFSINHLN